MKKLSGHYCRIGGRRRPNEEFSRRGHQIHVCKDCARMPKEEREAIEQEEEIFQYLRQSHISNKNIARLEELAGSSKERIAEHAALVLEIARIKPYKRKRLKTLARTRRDLLMKLEDTGLIFAHHW
jgi:ribosome-binding protein aMBF1 (putative translation factor)